MQQFERHKGRIKMNTTGRESKLHIDVLRILAAFLVLYNHTSGYHYYLTEYTGVRETGLYILLSVITRINVPIFYMISGALLLGRNESYASLFSKRILRFAAVLVGASAVTYAMYHRRTLGVWDFISKLLTGNISIPYWFLYAYLGFLFTLPFLRKAAQKLDGADILMLFGGVSLIRILPQIAGIMSRYLFDFELPRLSGQFSLPFIDIDVFFYTLVGFYFENNVSAEEIKKWLPCLAGASLAGILISAAATILQGTKAGFTQDYLGLCVRIYAPAMYLMIKYAVMKLEEKGISQRVQKAICTLGGLTLGVYLMDPPFKLCICRGPYIYLENTLHPVLFSFGYCIISLLCCSMITHMLRKNSFIRKLL